MKSKERIVRQPNPCCEEGDGKEVKWEKDQGRPGLCIHDLLDTLLSQEHLHNQTTPLNLFMSGVDWSDGEKTVKSILFQQAPAAGVGLTQGSKNGRSAGLASVFIISKILYCHRIMFHIKPLHQIFSYREQTEAIGWETGNMTHKPCKTHISLM